MAEVNSMQLAVISDQMIRGLWVKFRQLAFGVHAQRKFKFSAFLSKLEFPSEIFP
jgi:hypothetical protein